MKLEPSSDGYVLDPRKQKKEFLNPREVLKAIGLEVGKTFADFGCGGGYFTIPAGKMVGEYGKVYAVDILKEALRDVEGKAKIEGLRNIQTVWADLEIKSGTKITADSVDIVFISHVFYQSDKHSPILEEAKRVVKPEGEIVVIEWEKVDIPFGPPLEARVAKKDAIEAAQKSDLSLSSEFEAGSYHYGLILKKSAVAQEPEDTIKYE